MKIYINEKERYNDVKSTGYSFTIISVIGFILLILMWTNTLPINIDITNKIMTSVVMGILFTIFLIIGIKSFLSLKKIQESADNQEKTLLPGFLIILIQLLILLLKKTISRHITQFQRY